MKLLLLSDGHLLWDKPQGRIDDVRETQFDKWRFILQTAALENAIILQAGDFFNRPRSWYLLPEVMYLLKEYKVPIYCVFGQHDTYMYSEKTRRATSLGILEAADMVNILSDKPFYTAEQLSAAIYGCSYGQEIPKIEPPFREFFTVLVIHAPIAEHAEWPGQNYMDAETFATSHPEYDLILCGDIHRRFCIKWDRGAKWIVNTGPLIRKESTVYNFTHKPGFYIFDTTKNEDPKWVEIPHRPAEEVLSRAHLDYEKEGDAVLKDFISSINNPDIKEEADFIEILWSLVRANNIKQSVIDSLSEVTGNGPTTTKN
jgi:DNA repair exonuclease SbcCD nuclease subunit